MIAGSWQQQRQAVVEESLWNFVTTSSLIAATCFVSKEQLPHAISFASTPVASAETAPPLAAGLQEETQPTSGVAKSVGWRALTV